MAAAGGHIVFVLLAINPVGGLLVAIPLGVFHLHYPSWFLVLVGPPLAYVQVVVVDVAWDQLNRLAVWRRLLQRYRSKRVEYLLASGGAFWPTFLLAPVVGPWAVMAFMRYAQVPQRRVAMPLYLSIATVAVIVTALCQLVPQWFLP